MGRVGYAEPLCGHAKSCLLDGGGNVNFTVMFGASLLKLLSFGLSFTASEQMILVLGMGTAFISSVLVIRFLLAFIKKHDFNRARGKGDSYRLGGGQQQDAGGNG